MSYEYEDRLEGVARLRRIRRIKTLSYMVLAIVAAAACAVQVIALGPTVQPPYVPLAPVIPTTLLAVFVAFLLGLFFRYFEIQHVRNEGQRYRIIERNRRQALTFIVALGIATVVLALPWVHGGVVSGLSETFDRTLTRNATYAIAGGVWTYDGVGLSRVTAFTVRSVAGTLAVTIFKSGQNAQQTRLFPGQATSISLDTSRRFLYNITISNPAFPIAEFSLTVVRDLFSELYSSVPFALGIFVAANVGWSWGLRSLASRLEPSSILEAPSPESGTSPRGRLAASTPPASTAPFLDLLPPPPTDLPGPDKAPAGAVVLLHVSPKENLSAPAQAFGASRPSSAVGGASLDRTTDLADQRELDEALSRYDAILKRNPGQRDAALGKAGVLVKLGRRPVALGLYRQILRDDRGNLEALEGCLAIHEADQAWRSALDVADEIVALLPDDADALAKRGDILMALKRPAEARGAYERALAQQPDDPDLRARVARLQVDIPLLVSRAFVASAGGNYQEAVDAFDRVLQLEPENLNVRVGKSAALRQLGRVDEARDLLHEILERNPVHSAALLAKAQLLSETGDLTGALDALDALLAVHAGDPDALLERGDVLARMGRTEDAQESYEAALKLNPDDLDAAEKLKALVEGEASQRAVLRELFRIRGIGPVKAKALIDAGFRTVDDLRRATVDDLARVAGVTEKSAEDIVKHFRR